MLPNFLRRLAPAALCAAALAVQAQADMPANAASAATAARPDPLNAQARVPALSYESSFARYRRLSDDKALSWRDANDTVMRIGGWRAYAREAQGPVSVGPAASAATPSKPAGTDNNAAKPMPTPMPQGHTGHKSP